MKKYFVLCLIPLVNISFFRYFKLFCARNQIPVLQYYLRELMAFICCLPVAGILWLISFLVKEKWIIDLIFYICPMIMGFLMIHFNKKDVENATNQTGSALTEEKL